MHTSSRSTPGFGLNTRLSISSNRAKTPRNLQAVQRHTSCIATGTVKSMVLLNLVRGTDAVECMNCSELGWDLAVLGLAT